MASDFLLVDISIFRQDMQEQKKYRLLKSLEGHTGVIFRIAWSPNGDLIASPCKDKTVRLWQTCNDSESRILKETDTEPATVAWSPDGMWFVVVYDGGFTIIFDSATGKVLRKLEGHSRDVIAVSVSPCGKYVASAGDSGEIIVWTASNGNLVHRILAHTNWVMGLSWSSDGRFLASCSRDRSICVWSASGKLRQRITGHLAYVNDVKWRPESNELASASHDGTVRFWDRDSGEQIMTHRGHESEVNCLSFSYDGRFYATKSTDSFVQVRDCTTGAILLRLNEPSSRFFFSSIAFHPSSFLLATLGEEDTIVRLWELYPENWRDAEKVVEVGTDFGTSFQIVHSSYTLMEALEKIDKRIEKMAEEPKRIIDTGGGHYYESIDTGGGDYVQGNHINMSQDLTHAATQIQDLIEQLQKQGVAVDVAQEKVATDLANQVQKTPLMKDKLLKWGQSLGDATVSDVVKGAVKLAIRSAGIPLP
jgi:WD40 repeat protein